MKARLLIACAAGLGLILASVPVFAHHSFAAEFDINKPVTLTGTVTKLEWMNPHTHFYIDVKDGDSKVTNWDLETGSPNALSRRGWTRHVLKAGDTVTVEGYRAKDGANLTSVREVTLADGRKLFAGSADYGDAGSDNATHR